MSEIDPDLWLDEYGDYLFRFALSRVFSREIAEDLLQETLLSACKAKDSFQGRASVKTWLTEILKNKIIDHHRKVVRTTNNEIAVDEESELDSHFNSFGIWNRMLADWGRDPEEQLNSQEFFNIFRSCLAKLPEKNRALLIMSVFENRSSTDICNEIGITSSNYWVVQHRSRNALRECLEKNWVRKR